MSIKYQYKTSFFPRQFFLTICLGVLFSGYSQNQIVFNKGYNNFENSGLAGGGIIYNNEFSRCVQVNTSGYLFAGYTENFLWSPQGMEPLSELFYAQVNEYGDTVWQKTFNVDSLEQEDATDIKEFDSGYLLAGIIEEDTNTADRYFNSLLMKVDYLGNLEYYKEYNYADFEFIRRIVLVENDLYLLHNIRNHGTSYSTPCLSKIDSFGNEIWRRCFSNPTNTGMGDIKYIDGLFYITGATDNLIDPYYYTLYKVDTSGMLIDSFGYLGDSGLNIISGTSGNTGYYFDENGLHLILTGAIELSTNNNAAYVMSIDETGQKEWGRIIDPGPKNELFTSCQVLPDGRIVAISNRKDYEARFPNPNGSVDMECWLTMLDKQGNTIWNRYIRAHYYPISEVYPYQVKTAQDGGFVITGYVINNFIESNGIYHRNDAWLCKTDSCGYTTGAVPTALFTVDSIEGYTVFFSNLSEEYCIGNYTFSSIDPLTEDTIQMDSLNIYAYSNWTTGENPAQMQYTFPDTGKYIISLNTYAGDGSDSYEILFTVLDSTTNIVGAPTMELFEFSIYPNPTRDFFIVAKSTHFVDYGIQTAIQGKLINLIGQEVYEFTLDNKRMQQKIVLPELNNGVYTIQLSTNELVLGTKKVVLAK